MSSILKKRPVQGQHQQPEGEETKTSHDISGSAQQPEPKKAKEDGNDVVEGVQYQMQEAVMPPQPPAAVTSAEIVADNDDNDDDDDDDETTKDSAGEREKAKKQQWLKPSQSRSPRVGSEFQADI